MKIGLFIPCYIDQLQPSIGIQALNLLKKLSFNDIYCPDKVFCCGQPPYNAGLHQEAKQLCTHFYHHFKQCQVIITPSASCSGFLTNYAPKLMIDNLYSQPFFDKIIDIAQFLHQHNIDKLHFQPFPFKVAYHTSCAALRENPITNLTLQILQHIPQIQLTPFDYAEKCCGFGGSFAEKFPELSVSMANHKIQNIEKSGAQVVISNDYSCLLQLKSVAQKNNASLIFKHWLEILNTN